MKTVRLALPAFAFALLLLLPMFLLPVFSAEAQTEPQPGTVQGIGTFTFHPEAAVSNGTSYSDAPELSNSGLDVTRIAAWHAGDVFVAVDIEGTATLTVTPQFSPDQSNWTDADYRFMRMDANGVATETVQTQQLVLTADGTDLLRLPMAGEYLRFKFEASGVAAPTNTIDAAVYVTLRND